MTFAGKPYLEETPQPQRFWPNCLGQHCPIHCPNQKKVDDRLGRPLTLKQTARMIGCSPWTIRQKLIPKGLPHLQVRAKSRLIFYEKQIQAWIKKKQRRGRILP